MSDTPATISVRATVTGAVDLVNDQNEMVQVSKGERYSFPVGWFPADPDGEPIIPAGLAAT